jgi:PAS domain S-box-containing protein
MSTQKNDPGSRENLKKEAEAFLHFDPESSADVIAIFDSELNYVFANNEACKLLSKEKHELEGNNFLKIFPQLTASVSHRNLLSALSGKIIQDAISEGNVTKEGARFISDYYPLKNKDKVYAVIAVTKKLYFP